MSKPQKIVINLGIPSTKIRPKAMSLAAKVHVAITGNDKDQLEVVGVGVDATCLVNCLRKKVVRSASILLMEEVKDKEEEKKKPEEKKPEELLEWGWPGYYYPQRHPLPMFFCEEPTAEGRERNHLVVVGDGLDAVGLTSYLRKKVGGAQIVQVEVVGDVAAATTTPRPSAVHPYAHAGQYCYDDHQSSHSHPDVDSSRARLTATEDRPSIRSLEVNHDATPHDPRERSAPTRCCNPEEAGRPKP
ncbi:hypothetical protein HU200_032204 [Digitaria exilis]|uniref:Uncharacterized protein n=1 Tax=Digitaria exilis TaxID=1010633 RepID=A0A835BTY2_9POAL|nr:hypothetical protein HU200_032204 [Digitaria exilis]